MDRGQVIRRRYERNRTERELDAGWTGMKKTIEFTVKHPA